MKTLPAILFLFILSALSQAQDFSRSDSSLDVTHYRLELFPEIGSKTLIGICRIEFRVNGVAPDTISLDAVGMEIHSVKNSSGTDLGFRYDSTTLKVSQKLQPNSKRTSTFVISYKTTPAKGMHFVAPDASFPNAQRQFWTHNQPDDARYWFPCHDVPWDKATSEIIVHADSELVVISNGTVETVTNTGPKKRWHWRFDKPHSPYLIAVAGGIFDEHRDEYRGIPVVSYFPPGIEQSIVTASYASTPAMMAFFETCFGSSYPWKKYAQVPLQEFPHGGMENTTATFLSDQQVLMDMRARQDYTDEHLIAHELAHQWWGDLVTCRSWEDMWINEGFATYMQQLWTRFSDGRDEYEYQRFQGKENILRYLNDDSPLTVRAHEKNSAHNLYTKGAAILAMISEKIGEGVFNRCMKYILQNYAYSTISTEDLIREFETASGKTLRPFVLQWLDRSSYPIVEISYVWQNESKRIHVKLQQKNSAADGTLFSVPVSLAFGRDGKKQRVEFASDDTLISIALEHAPEFVEVDQLVPAVFNLDATHDESSAMLRFATSPASRIVAARSLIKDIHLADARTALFYAAENDQFYGVRLDITNALTHLVNDSSQDGLALKALFLRLSKDANSRVRATAFNGLSSFRDSSLTEHFLDGLRDSSYHVAAAALNALAMIGSKDIEQLLRSHLTSSSYKDILATSAMQWAPTLDLPELALELLDLLKPGHAIQLRYEALKTLLQLKTAAERLPAIIEAMLNEPALDIRYLGVAAMRYAYPELALRLYRKRLEVETDSNLILLMKRFIEKAESAP